MELRKESQLAPLLEFLLEVTDLMKEPRCNSLGIALELVKVGLFLQEKAERESIDRAQRLSEKLL